MPTEFRKQISIFLPLSDWKAIRREAARLRIPMTELCRRWMRSDLSRLTQASSPTGARAPRPPASPDRDEPASNAVQPDSR